MPQNIFVALTAAILDYSSQTLNNKLIKSTISNQVWVNYFYCKAKIIHFSNPQTSECNFQILTNNLTFIDNNSNNICHK